MSKYLIKTTKYFVDPHGTPDEGGSYLEVVNSLLHDDGSIAFRDDMYMQHDEWREEDELYASEDGYNSEAEGYQIVELTDDQAERFTKLIHEYNEIDNLFD